MEKYTLTEDELEKILQDKFGIGNGVHDMEDGDVSFCMGTDVVCEYLAEYFNFESVNRIYFDRYWNEVVIEYSSKHKLYPTNPLLSGKKVIMLDFDAVEKALKEKFGPDVFIDGDKGCPNFTDDEQDFLGECLGVKIENIFVSDGNQDFDDLLVFYSDL
jgi:hypothetical protein